MTPDETTNSNPSHCKIPQGCTLAYAEANIRRSLRAGGPIPEGERSGADKSQMKNHRLIDERSLAFDRLIAAKLRRDPSLVDKAHGNLARWLQTFSSGARPALLEWQRLLASPFDELIAFLESDDERATRLRQSNPFCGILTAPERLAIIRQFQERESHAA